MILNVILKSCKLNCHVKENVMGNSKSVRQWLIALFLVFIVPVGSSAGIQDSDPAYFFKKMQMLKKTIIAGKSINKKPEIKIKKGQALKVQSEGGISGIVGGFAENSVPNGFVLAWVSQKDSSLGNFGFSAIAEDGSYEIKGLSSGDFYVYVQVDGYIPLFFPGTERADSAQTVKVLNSEVTTGINFILKKYHTGSGSITGTVVNNSNGQPISGAFVFAWLSNADSTGVGSSNNYAWTNSDENGNYSISELESGSYFISAWADGFSGELYSSGTLVPVFDLTVTDNINFSLTKTASISGTVTSSEGNPLKWVYVSASSDEKGDSSNVILGYSGSYTDENGNYSISNIEDGNYYLNAITYFKWNTIDEWYKESSTREGAEKVVVQNGESVSGIDFTLEIPNYKGMISGKILDKDGAGLADASVLIYNAVSDSLGSSITYYYSYTTSDFEGNYSFSEIPDGIYFVKTYSYNNWKYSEFWYPSAKTEQDATVIELKNGNQISGITIQTSQKITTASISGKVLDLNNNPLSSAYIFLSSYQSKSDSGFISDPVWAYAFTDSSGNYSIQNIDKGKYILLAYYVNGSKNSSVWYNQSSTYEGATPVSVDENQKVTDINFVLNPKSIFGKLTGVVKNENGVPISGAYVTLTPYWEAENGNDKYFGQWNIYRITGDDGAFEIPDLYEGKYTVAVYADGGYVFYPDAVTPSLSTPVSVVADESTDLEIEVPIRNEGIGSISGIVATDFPTLVPIDGVVTAKPLVTILSFPQSEIFYSSVVKNGSYELKNLPDGDYFLYAFSGQMGGEFYDNVYDPSFAKKVSVLGGKSVTDINFSLAPYYNVGEKDSLAVITGARVFGKVFDVNGNLLTDVNLNLVNADDKIVASSKTNAKGYYEISGVGTGQYTLKPAKIGMEKAESKNEPLMMNKNNVEQNIVLKMTGSSVKVEDKNTLRAGSIELIGVYPNPFNPETTISFKLSKQSAVSISIFNLLGQQIRELSFSNLGAGTNQVRWNGRAEDGTFAASGFYLYRIAAGNKSVSGKMILSK